MSEETRYNIFVIILELLLWGMIWFGIFSAQTILPEYYSDQSHYENMEKNIERLRNH